VARIALEEDALRQADGHPRAGLIWAAGWAGRIGLARSCAAIGIPGGESRGARLATVHVRHPAATDAAPQRAAEFLGIGAGGARVSARLIAGGLVGGQAHLL